MEQKLQASNSEKGKRPPRPSSARSGGQPSTNEQSLSSDYVGKRSGEDKSPGNEVHGFVPSREKQHRRTRSRERLDRGVWTPRRSDASHAGDENQSNASDSCEGIIVTIYGSAAVVVWTDQQTFTTNVLCYCYGMNPVASIFLKLAQSVVAYEKVKVEI